MISMTGHLDVVGKYLNTIFISQIKCFQIISVPPTIIDEESSPSTVSIREKHNASLICKATGVGTK